MTNFSIHTNTSRTAIRGMRTNRAYSLVEILTVLGIIAALLAIALPALVSAREKARTSACAAGLHNLGLALGMYLSDNDGYYPADMSHGVFYVEDRTAKDWSDMLMPYVHSPEFPFCPSSRPLPYSYKIQNLPKLSGFAYNANLVQHILTRQGAGQFVGVGSFEGKLPAPAEVVIFFDARPGILSMRHPDMIPDPANFNKAALPGFYVQWREMPLGGTRHGGGANYLFADGHSRWLKPEQTKRENFVPGTR